MNHLVDERCSPSIVDKIVGEVFDPSLLASGFHRANPRKYVRARIPHTHDVVELLSRTVSLSLIWGLSLNFVPHIAGRQTETVRWHRTPRAATPDLRYSEVEDMRNALVRYAISTMHGAPIMRKQALTVRSALLPRAVQFFDSVTTLSSLGDLFVQKEQNPQFGDIFNTPQVALAYSFYLAKMGRESKARTYMSEWVTRSNFRVETNDRLSELFEEAIRTPLVVH
jgi:hypothetical protein